MDNRTANQLIKQSLNIKAQLAVKGWTLSAIDRKYKLPDSTARTTLREANRRGEEAIADTLDVNANTLWPERYDKITGQRLSPQPSRNYDRPPTIPQRRKLREAQT